MSPHSEPSPNVQVFETMNFDEDEIMIEVPKLEDRWGDKGIDQSPRVTEI